MRRANAISVKVRMPSRGLVTRLPSESADLFRDGDTQRAFAVAQQVRFEDGVVCAAPGYEQTVITGATGIALVTSGSVTQPAIGSPIVFTTTTNPITAGVAVGMVLAIPDAPTTDTYRVTARTSSTVTATLLTVGGTRVAGQAVANGTALTTANAPNGPILRLHQGNLLDPAWLLSANTLADQGTPLVAATSNSLYSISRSFNSPTAQFDASFTNIFTGTAADVGVPWFVADSGARIFFAQRSNIPQTWVSNAATTYPMPGLPTTDALWDGVEVFFQHTLLWRGNRLKWSDVNDFTNFIPVGSTASSFILTVSATTFTQPALGASVVIPVNENPVALGAVVGQYIRINADPYFSFYLITAVSTTTVTATLQSLTDSIPTGTVVASTTQVFSLNANEAGEVQVTGSDSNGPILNVTRLGDYAFIFKSRSISSMQYVGLGSGIFFIHTEVTNEGLIAPQAVINLGDGRLIFWGHRELYQYSGGPTPVAVCQQVTRQIYAELDRSRLGEIILYHNENRKEVWLHYPIIGGNKVLVWNYVEDTATFDLVNPTLSGITALAAADWTSDIRWIDLADDLLWSIYDPTISWLDLTSGTSDHLTLFGSGDSLLRVHGLKYTQDGLPYTALAETMDFDFGDNDAFKYIDVVILSAQVKVLSDFPKNLYLQIGSKNSLEGSLRWTTPQFVNLQGNAPPPSAPPLNLVVPNLSSPNGTFYYLATAFPLNVAYGVVTTPGQQYKATLGPNEAAIYMAGVPLTVSPDRTVIFTATAASIVFIGVQSASIGSLCTARLEYYSTPAPVRTYAPIKVNPGGSGRYIRLRFFSQDADVEWRISTYEISCRKGNTY